MRYETLRSEYAELWATMELRQGSVADVEASAKKMLRFKQRYKAVQEITGAPWFVVGIIHLMECGGDFNKHLHNGDPLTARTRRVPKGCPKDGAPPFEWEESAADALRMKSAHKITDWSIPRICHFLEGYNGWGYRRHHKSVLSPYLWSKTNHYTRGKYIADGKWSSTAVSGQSGAMAILKIAMMHDKSIVVDDDGLTDADAFPKADDEDAAPNSMVESTTGNAAVVTGAGGTTTVAMEVSGAFNKLWQMGKPFAANDFLMALATSPTFWIAVITVALSAYIWLERRKKLVTLGV